MPWSRAFAVSRSRGVPTRAALLLLLCVQGAWAFQLPRPIAPTSRQECKQISDAGDAYWQESYAEAAQQCGTLACVGRKNQLMFDGDRVRQEAWTERTACDAQVNAYLNQQMQERQQQQAAQVAAESAARAALAAQAQAREQAQANARDNAQRSAEAVRTTMKLLNNISDGAAKARDPGGYLVDKYTGKITEINSNMVAGPRQTGNATLDAGHEAGQGLLDITSSNPVISAIQKAALGDIQRLQEGELNGLSQVSSDIAGFAQPSPSASNPWATSSGGTLPVRESGHPDPSLATSSVIRDSGSSSNADSSSGNPWATSTGAPGGSGGSRGVPATQTTANPWGNAPTTNSSSASYTLTTPGAGQTLYRPSDGADVVVVPLSAVDSTLGGDSPTKCSPAGVGRVTKKCETKRNGK